MNTIKDSAAFAVQLASGFLGILMLVGLVPGDGFDVNTLGALVIAVLSGAAYYGVRTYRRTLHH